MVETDGFPESLFGWGAEDNIFGNRILHSMGSNPIEWRSSQNIDKVKLARKDSTVPKFVRGNEHCAFWDTGLDGPGGRGPEISSDLRKPSLSAAAKNAEHFILDHWHIAWDGGDEHGRAPGLSFDGYVIDSRVETALYTHLTISAKREAIDRASEKAAGFPVP
jgi:hypothetical protein